jgi:NAD(P)-dependent dehydrogenase (short-subunit alcohol dehydrogenase family)
MRRRFLVTGGAGFIGSAFVRHAVAATDHHVLVVDKLTYAGNLDSLVPVKDHPRFRFVRADIADAAAMKAALADFQPDVILHLAAESHVDRSIDGPAAFVETNVVGTFVLLQQRSAIGARCPRPKRRASAFTMSRPTRCSGRSMRMGTSARIRPIGQTHLTQRRRRPPITWCVPGTIPTACRSWSPTARTISALVIFRKSSSR